jgi:5-methylcytosine-specific restriction endonuclease McrA
MSEIALKKLMLNTLYSAHEIQQVWQNNQHKKLIKHPNYGWISPNEYRSKYAHKPCPYCGQKMVHGNEKYITNSKKEAIKRGYEYQNKQGKPTINQITNNYFHPNYITLDHKINKARCPNLLFDYDNLEAICWRCNNDKNDDNSFELNHNLEYFNELYEVTKIFYPQL